jgi:hypothetical protein
MMYRPASSHIFFEDSRSASQERESVMQRASRSPVEAAELGTLPLFDDGGYIA